MTPWGQGSKLGLDAARDGRAPSPESPERRIERGEGPGCGLLRGLWPPGQMALSGRTWPGQELVSAVLFPQRPVEGAREQQPPLPPIGLGGT